MFIPVVSLFTSGFTSFVAAVLILPAISYIARYFKILDQPDGKLKNHTIPVPHFGGAGIFFTLFLSIAWLHPEFFRSFFWILIGSFGLCGIGLYDDLFFLSPHAKFFGQALVVTFLVFVGGLGFSVSFLPVFVGNFLTAFWMLTVINAFNLIDVMDGLVAVTSIIAMIFLTVIAYWQTNVGLVLLLSLFLGVVIAFFIYNRPPASMYLGDAGAHLLGGFFAVAPFILDWGDGRLRGMIIPTILLGIPLSEVVTLIAIRFYKGLPLHHGSPHHFSMYLLKKGWSKTQVLLFVACAASCLGLLVLAMIADMLPLLSGFIISLISFGTWCQFVFRV